MGKQVERARIRNIDLTLRFALAGCSMTRTLIAGEVKDFATEISVASPIGEALVEMAVGETRTVQVPCGPMDVKLLEIVAE